MPSDWCEGRKEEFKIFPVLIVGYGGMTHTVLIVVSIYLNCLMTSLQCSVYEGELKSS